ncbi:hypothetical protein ACVWYQ_003417 [Bradyrhizobium sp. USDA 3397]
MLLSPLLGLWLPMPRIGARGEEAEPLEDPDVQLELAGRSGPLVVEIEYRVAQENARAFHNAMQAVQPFRQRTGAYGWSLARDIADPESWRERYYCPTWFDYLRQRNRATQSERALERAAAAFHIGSELYWFAVCWRDRLARCAGGMIIPAIPRMPSCSMRISPAGAVSRDLLNKGSEWQLWHSPVGNMMAWTAVFFAALNDSPHHEWLGNRARGRGRYYLLGFSGVLELIFLEMRTLDREGKLPGIDNFDARSGSAARI